jgi:hypothetical protein
MNDSTNELISTLKQLRQRYPSWRFGQMIENVAAWAGTDKPGSVGEISDKALLQAARNHLKQFEGRSKAQKSI